MLLKIHAFIYRVSGIFTKYARKKEKEYIKSLGDVSDFERNLMTGLWHANNGFYRSSKHLKRNIKKNKG